MNDIAHLQNSPPLTNRVDTFQFIILKSILYQNCGGEFCSFTKYYGVIKCLYISKSF